MPLYEYVAQDGTVIELMRPMSDADKPVQDPDGKGRTFVRKHSTFAAKGGGLPLAGGGGGGGGGGHVHSGSCGCGKPRGSCGMN